LGQGPQPSQRRARELRREDLRVAGHQLPVSAEIPNYPTDADAVAAAPCRGEILGFGALPVRSADRGAEVSQGVDAFDEDQLSEALIDEPHVGGSRRIGWPRRQLEATGVPGRAGYAQYQFLDAQVPGIKRFLNRISRELDAQASVERDRDALESVGRVAAALATLDLADR
jgi:hypothetical protein